MNEAFCNVISEGDEARRDLFVTTAGRMGTAVQYVEKDFWVCWTLDALFHGLRAGAPRLLFKGGTSLSKSFGLINRFSEDIDITVFRGDLGQAATVEDLEALSGKKRKAKLDAIKTACQAFIKGPLRDDLRAAMRQLVSTARIPEDAYRIEVDRDDPDEQSLLFWYPTVTAAAGQYVRSAVKVEGGGKSALDPNLPTTIKPYVNDDLPGVDLRISGITTVEAERTFWDKVVILHGLRRWYDIRTELRQGGQRVSRHYYDVFRLLASGTGRRAVGKRDLAIDCARHARMFFDSRDLDLAHAEPGSFALTPSLGMREPLRRDYEAMAPMILGAVPPFEDVMTVVADLEKQLNAGNKEHKSGRGGDT